MNNSDLEFVASNIVDTAVKLHMRLGPGMIESVYVTVLAKQIELRGFPVERQKSIDIEIDGIRFVNVCRADLVVSGMIVVEVKSIEKISPVHTKQLLTYLDLLQLPLGFLLNFGAATMKEGIRRIVSARHLRDFVP